MGAFLVTGVSGSGKSTLAERLARRGIAAIDTDADPRLARFVDGDGNAVRRPSAPDMVWLATHRWVWSATRLAELLVAHPAEPLFLCGHADNETEFFDRFERILLLQIDESTMLSRLDDPRRENDFGLVGDTREQVKRWRAGFQKRMLELGAIPIDATAPLPVVVDALLTQASFATIDGA